MRVRVPLVSLVMAVVFLAGWPAAAQDWPQWALNPQHTGASSAVGQRLDQNLADVVYDPLVPQETAATGGALAAHFQSPLVDGSDVYMMFKSGTFDPTDFSTQTWGETKYLFSGKTLNVAWQFTTDWKAPGSLFHDFAEPVFHPALANGFLYVPGAGGTLIKVNKSTGAQVARINPFGTLILSSRFTISPITVDAAGNLYYNALQLKAGTKTFYSDDVVDSWLVKVTPGGIISKVSYRTLVPDAPAATAPCEVTFSNAVLPWPPSPTAVAPTTPCGSVRAAVSAAPAIAPDGTIYTLARAHNAAANRYSWLVAVNPNLTRKWDSSLRNRFHDGCGVSISEGGVLPPNGAPGGCRAGANFGVDPGVNHAGDGRVFDSSTASPVVAPDGSIFYGAFTRYNYAQGHMMHFAADGSFLGAYRYGFDTTPGIRAHGGTYSVLLKDNQYGGLGSYCNVEAICPSDRTATNPEYPEAFFVTELNHNLEVEWRFQSTNTLSCSRDANGDVTCVDDHPHGFEWCVDAFVIDGNGVAYVNSEDGNLFAINPDGTLRQEIFQQLALAAAYTPTSIGSDGRIYSQNAGHLFVVGE